MIAVNTHVRRTRSLEVPSPPPFPSPPLPPGQINYLSKKNHLSRLLREQQAAVSQIVRELRAIRGSLEVIDGIHEELQKATDDYSTTSYATPYYSYLVKRLPIESNSNKAASPPPQLTEWQTLTNRSPCSFTSDQHMYSTFTSIYA